MFIFKAEMADHVGYSLGEDDIKKEEIEIKMEPQTEPQTETTTSKANDPPKQLKLLKCHVCHKIMGHRSSLYKHLKYVHKIKPAHRVTITCNEKGCFESFTFIEPFRKHLAEQHGFDIVVEKYVFRSMPEFFNWKKLTEQEEHLRFIVSTGPRNSRNGKIHYYRCQKNGVYRPEIKKRLQSDSKPSTFVSTTHCISSMFVFEEPECVTVEFCRTHYGHELNAMPPGKERRKRKEKETSDLNLNTTTISENNIDFEAIDSYEKLKSLLSEKDKTALVSILSENRHLLQETEELFYENEKDVIMKIPFKILRNLIKDNGSKDSKSDDDGINVNEETPITGTEGDTSCDETAVIEKLEEEELENENSAILKSLGNGVFLDPTSNKRLKLDSLKKRRSVLKKGNVSKQKKVDATDSNRCEELKDWESNKMLVKEYLNEFDEKVYVLEPVKDQETIVQKREKILSQLQTILMMVNSEDDADVLDEIRNHLSKYAAPE